MLLKPYFCFALRPVRLNGYCYFYGEFMIDNCRKGMKIAAEPSRLPEVPLSVYTASYDRENVEGNGSR